MGLLSLFSFFGSFLLFVSFILLLVTSISSPTVDDLSLLRINLNDINNRHITFGSWGYCVTQPGPNACTGAHVGYNAGAYLNQAIGANFGRGTRDTIHVLTRAMILHPIAAAFALLAFLASAAHSICGALFALILTLITFILTIIVLGCDFGWAVIVHHRVNENNFRGATAHYRECIWFVVAAAILSFIALLSVAIGCCSSRNRNKDQDYTTTRRRRFF